MLAYLANLALVCCSIFYLLNKGVRTIFLGFAIGYLLTNYIGILILYFGLDEYRASIGVVQKEIMAKVFVYSVLSYWMVFITSFYGSKHRKPSFKIRLLQLDKHIYMMLIFLVFFFTFFYLAQLDNIALFQAMIGAEDVEKIRSEMGNANQSSHWIRLFISVICVFLGYVSIVLIKHIRGAAYKISNIFIQAVVFFLLVIDTSKFAIVQYFIGILALEYFGGEKNISRKLIQFSLIGLVGIFGMYYIFASLENFGSIIQAASSRMVTGSIAPSYFYLEYIEQTGKYFLGTTFPNPGNILPFQSVSVSVFIRDWWFGYSDDGIVGSSPTTFWAEAFVNFGIIGIVFSSFYIGCLIRLLDFMISKFSDRIIVRASYGWFSAFLFTANISGISEFVKPIFIVVLAGIMLLGISKYGKG